MKNVGKRDKKQKSFALGAQSMRRAEAAGVFPRANTIINARIHACARTRTRNKKVFSKGAYQAAVGIGKIQAFRKPSRAKVKFGYPTSARRARLPMGAGIFFRTAAIGQNATV